MFDYSGMMKDVERFPRPIVRKQRPIVREAYPCRPTNRIQCVHSQRPCVFVSCRYNMFLDVMKKRIKLYGDDPIEMEHSCALDLADEYGGMKLEEIAVHFGLSRERVRQIQDNALRKIMRFIEDRR